MPCKRDYAETIRDSGAALLTVTMTFWTSSKVEAGKLELENSMWDLRDTLRCGAPTLDSGACEGPE